MHFGADYYPEHWPGEIWEQHAKLMREANFNVVRLAEFAWAKMEPTEGKYDFSWLDEAIDVLSKEGIKVVLGTPTATPPKWLMDKYPEAYQVDAYGRVRGFGSRRHYCANSPAYLEKTKDIVGKMADHYKNHPDVVAWQIDNELGCHSTVLCYCNHCKKAFHQWLEQKYGDIRTLNKEWGTVFWSQTYHSWDEIVLPEYTACEAPNQRSFAHNPALLLDFSRFSSDSVIRYQNLQIEQLRATGCRQPVTHNLMGHFSEIDCFKQGEKLDFVSWDNYIHTPWGESGYQAVSMAHDLIRGVKNKNFWVMEQQSGPCGWETLGSTPRPGQLRLWTYQALAHGAEAIVYFRWRACPFGTEEYWYGILDHDGIPRRRYFEIQQTGSELRNLSHLFIGSRVLSRVAVVKSYDNYWSHGFQPHNKGFDYNGLLTSYYTAVANHHVNCDVISVDSSFENYKLLLMPAFNLMTDAIRTKLKEYVKGGGNLVVTFRSGTRHWNNSMTTQTLPGYFRELSGICVEEFDSLNFGRKVRVKGDSIHGTASVWCDVLKPETAEVMARYADEYYAGEPAVTVNRYGGGKVYYIGCDLDQSGLDTLLKRICHDGGILPAFSHIPDGVEVVMKEKEGQKYAVILNHNPYESVLPLDKEYKECLTGVAMDKELVLPQNGVAILT